MKTDFRNCEMQDFHNKRYFPAEKGEMENLQLRLCPSMDVMKDYIQIKNSYTNQTERVSFSIEISKC